MSITQAVCNQYKLDVGNGVHQPGDVYKIALYVAAAALDKTTTAYTATGEVATGGGYTAGGIALTGRTFVLSGDTAILDFTDPVWPAATILARGALIYNSTRSNAAMFVLDFGSDIISTAGPFTVDLPAQGAGTSLWRLT